MNNVCNKFDEDLPNIFVYVKFTFVYGLIGKSKAALSYSLRSALQGHKSGMKQLSDLI